MKMDDSRALKCVTLDGDALECQREVKWMENLKSVRNRMERSRYSGCGSSISKGIRTDVGVESSEREVSCRFGRETEAQCS